MNSLRQHNTIVDVIGAAWDGEGENNQNEENNPFDWPTCCNQGNSAHVHPITNHRQHRTSKRLLTQQTKVLAVPVADHIVTPAQRTLFTFRHTISEQ